MRDTPRVNSRKYPKRTVLRPDPNFERVGWQKAAVALANKNARILWAVMTRGEAFNPRHVSVKPGAATPTPATA